MATETPLLLMDLTDVDREILDLLAEGRATQGYLVDRSGRSRNQVHNRLALLAASGYVDRIHDSTALYELVEDPREAAADEEADQ